MKKPSEIYGFVEIEDEKYPFHFSTTKFELEVFPPTINKWDDLRLDIFKLFEKKRNRHRWLNFYKIEGITSSNQQICFSIREEPITNSGFRKYYVQWVFYKYETNTKQIDGIRLSGGDVDYFFPAENHLQSKVEFRNNHTIKYAAIESKEIINKSCGKYRCSKGVDATMNVFASSTVQFDNAEQPIYAQSSLDVDYSEPRSIEEVINNIKDIRSFFIYSFYRRNVYFENISTFTENEDGVKCLGGQILFPNQTPKETHEKKKEMVIKYNFWHKNMARMLSEIKNKKIGFDHICSEIKMTHSYPISRFIMILAEFEREFRNIYGNESIRSEDYEIIKKEVVTTLQRLKNRKTGRNKKRINSIIKGIKNSNDIYKEKVKKALNDCESIMSVFVKDKYTGSYQKNIELIADRISEIRNGIAHSKLNFRVKAINIDDIQIMEKLNYAIRLKKYEKNEIKIVKAIADLFDDRIPILG